MKNLYGELKKRNLPDLFYNFESKQKASTLKEWQDVMRPFWIKQLLKEEYGEFPPVITPQISIKPNRINFAGKAV